MLKEALKKFSQGSLAKDKKALLLIVLGSISWCITMVKSGVIYSFGMGFWGANGHDGIWHLALINSLAKGNLAMPVFAGENIKNYHIGFDLILAAIVRITSISPVTLYFQIVPPILALLVGVSVFLFVNKWKGRIAALWSVFFIYFGGDLGWIVTLIRDGKLGGESMFWSQQSVSTLINPPFALSLVFIFFGLYFLLEKKLFLPILMFGLLIEIKAYAGVLVLGGLFTAEVFEYFIERKVYLLKVFGGAAVLTVAVFLIFNRGTQNPFVVAPFLLLFNIFNPDRFSIPRLSSAIWNYFSARNLLKLSASLFVAFVVFVVGNMGTRLVGVWEDIRWVRKKEKDKYMNVFFLSVVLAGILIPMIFVQKGTPWNTIQFFYFSLIFSGVLAGIAISSFLKNKKKLGIVIGGLAILLTIPTTISTLLNNYIPSRPPAKVSSEELSGLDFLSKQGGGVVLTYPFDRDAAVKAIDNPPRPLYLYDSTAYVSAMSGKQTFLEDEVNLDITGFDWRVRREEVLKFLGTLDQNEAKKFLANNNIDYVYWVKPQRAKLSDSQLGLANIFENSEVVIYKVIK